MAVLQERRYPRGPCGALARPLGQTEDYPVLFFSGVVGELRQRRFSQRLVIAAMVRVWRQVST
jgi:hypothetical protein